MKAITGMIVAYEPELRQRLISLWEHSVRATHDFLSHEDVEFYKSIVQEIDFESFVVYCSIVGDQIAGFVGVADKKVEMLFLAPQFMNKGLGSKLLRYAIEELGANAVDVNEQNTGALLFYQKHGFVSFGRTEFDGQGRPYPILMMKRQPGQNTP